MRYNLLLIVASLLVLGGCVTSESPPTRYYLLSPEAVEDPSAKSARRALKVGIRHIEIPQYLNRPNLVSRNGTNRLELSSLNQWGGNLKEDIGRTLAANLSKRLNSPHVHLMPKSRGAQIDRMLFVEILAFETESLNNRVLLRAQWRVMDRRGRSLGSRRGGAQLSEIYTPIATPPEGSPDEEQITQRVAAMSQALARLSEEIATALENSR